MIRDFIYSYKELLMTEEKVERTRMNFSQDAKGFMKMDVTVEYETVELTEVNASKAIDAYQRICEAKGLKILQPASDDKK
jgi:hypothetical protein